MQTVPPVPPPVPPATDGSEAAGQPASSSGGFSPAQLAEDRPELAIGAAFAGGFLLAMILKRFAR
jgi:hypothetical protein